MTITKKKTPLTLSHEKIFLVNKKLVAKIKALEKCSTDLSTANKELTFQNHEKHKRAEELSIANKELTFQNKEKHKRAEELSISNTELERAERFEKENSKALSEMMFIISHKIRQPIAHILGFSNLLDNTKNSPNEFDKIVEHMKQSSQSLDELTRELSTFINEHEKKVKAWV